MTKSSVYNATDSPVVIADDGRIVGGREHADVDRTDQVRAALADGRLVDVDRKPPRTVPAAPATAEQKGA